MVTGSFIIGILSFLLETPQPNFSDFYKISFVTKLDLSIVIPVSY